MSTEPFSKPIDNASFKHLFEVYFERLHRYAYTLLKDQDEAKDAVQEVFASLWLKKDSLQIKQSPRAYLYNAVHNHCLNRIRNQQTRQRYYQVYGEQQVPEQPGKTMEEKEVQKGIHQLLQLLPGRNREVFMKSRFEGKKYHEIAEEMKISIKTVEAQMTKALKILRRALSANKVLLIINCSIIIHFSKFF